MPLGTQPHSPCTKPRCWGEGGGEERLLSQAGILLALKGNCFWLPPPPAFAACRRKFPLISRTSLAKMPAEPYSLPSCLGTGQKLGGGDDCPAWAAAPLPQKCMQASVRHRGVPEGAFLPLCRGRETGRGSPTLLRRHTIAPPDSPVGRNVPRGAGGCYNWIGCRRTFDWGGGETHFSVSLFTPNRSTKAVHSKMQSSHVMKQKINTKKRDQKGGGGGRE